MEGMRISVGLDFFMAVAGGGMWLKGVEVCESGVEPGGV